MATRIAVEVDVKTRDAASEIEDLKQQMEDLKKTTGDLQKKMEGGFKSAEKGAEGASKGIKGLGTRFKTLASATGIVFLLTEAFQLLRELLMGNQKVADTLSKVFTTVEIVFNNVFNAVSTLIGELRNLSSFSLKDVFTAFTNFGNAVSSAGDGALDTANKLVELRNEVKLAEAQQQLLMLQYQREAEIQRQIRDDVSKTIEERQAANVRLGGILDEQAAEELKLSNKRLELALLEQSINKDSIDAEVEVINARKEIADINERITGQRSEQLANENSLKLEGIQISKDRIKQLQEEAQAEADAAFKIAEAKIAADQLLEAYLAERQPMSREEMMQKEIDDALAAEEAKFQAAVAAAQQMGMLAEEIDGLESARLDEQMRIENEIRAKYGEEQAALNKEINDKIAKQNEDRRKGELTAEEKLAKAKLDLQNNTFQALSNISAMLTAMGVENIGFQKAIAFSEMLINQAVSIGNAVAAATSAAKDTGVAAPFTFAATLATIIGGVAATITQGIQILNSVPGPGGGGASTVSAPSAPSIAPVTTSTTEITNAEAAQLAPVQAFVVESQLSGSQENIQQIQNQATFGLTG
jgi:hypothetical protein